MTHHRLPLLSVFLAASAPLGCAPGGADTGAATDADGSTGGSGGSTGGSTGGDPDDPMLGETSQPECVGAVAGMQQLRTALDASPPDFTALRAAYLGEDEAGSALQTFVRTWGGRLGRVDALGTLEDEAAILAALETASAESAQDVRTRVELVASLAVRDLASSVSKAAPDAHLPAEVHRSAWDEAYCVWQGFLRPLAVEADGLGLDVESIEADIQTGFEGGFEGIQSAGSGSQIDGMTTPAYRQMLEKASFRAVHRLVLRDAADAADGDSVAQRRARGRFRMIEDRLAGRNTPGIAIIEGLLEGPVGDTDAGAIERELCVAFGKRTRHYADGAVQDGSIGDPEGFAGSMEGRTYSKICLPDLVARAPSVDPEAHLAAWQTYTDAVAGGDVDTATATASQLVAVWCEYQTQLGIAACTGSEDELP
jgi:hypothetical protein